MRRVPGATGGGVARGGSVVVLLVDHRAFAGLTLEQLKGKKLIDTRGVIRS